MIIFSDNCYIFEINCDEVKIADKIGDRYIFDLSNAIRGSILEIYIAMARVGTDD
jgi:hypothetical protein